ncbi:MAG: hypothetical protein ACTSRP_16885 [Candidatus Helarchaeota archaeon]
MRKNTKILGLLLMMILNFTFIPFSISGESTGKKFEETLICEDKDIITDDQWQWYKCVVELGQKIVVTLDYAGDLDLDLRLYWKRENFPEFNGFDLTHCSINDKKYNCSQYSQFRTHNTYELGHPEELYFTNPSYTKEEDKIAYILVYVHSGEGKSKYVLEANHDLIEINDNDVYDCNSVIAVLFAYYILMGIVFSSYVFIVVRKKRKILKSQRKEEEELKKKKQKDKLDIIDLDSELSK